jgi:hypothetical protein
MVNTSATGQRDEMTPLRQFLRVTPQPGLKTDDTMTAGLGPAAPGPERPDAVWQACNAGSTNWTYAPPLLKLSATGARGPRVEGSAGHGVDGGWTSSADGEGELCLTHPGAVVPKGWGPHLVLTPCDSGREDQHWKFTSTDELEFIGGGSASGSGVCVQADGSSPWLGVPAACYPCVPGSWPERILHTPSGALQLDMSRGGGGKICFGSYEVVTAPAVPSKQQLAWQDTELGALFQYNIGEYGELQNDYACGNQSVRLPAPSMFNPQRLNTTAWMESVVAGGFKYAVLTVQAGCGFLLHDTKSTLPDGSPYNYTIAQSPVLKGRDILAEFVAAARAAGIQPGVYYIVNNNVFLRTGSGKVGTVGQTKAGTVSVTQTEYEDIILAQLTEIWSDYGDLFELWFDGGTLDPALAPKIAPLLAKLQPNAVCFQGPTKQAARWAGSESGDVPEPNWSASKDSVAWGPGDPNAKQFAPSEADVTTSATGEWYW